MVISNATSTRTAVELDATTVPNGTTWSASICVIGAGPAGLALAESLRGTGHSVVVLESGGAGAQELPTTVAGGANTQELLQARARGIGGSALIWNTWFGGRQWAKYLPLDEVDFTRREWVPWSGWPISRATLDPWYERAWALCGLTPGSDAPPAAGRTGTLRPGVFMLGPLAQFAVTIPAALRSSTNVLLVQGATAVGLRRTGTGRITGVTWSSEVGGGTVSAETVVLAAGGIDNARFLLADRSATDNAPAVDWLGRGFMEHPIDRSVVVRSRRPALGLGEEFLAPRDLGNGPVVGRIGLAAELMRDERLPNLSIRLGEEEEPRLAPPAALRPGLHRLLPSQQARRLIGTALRKVLAMGDQLRGKEHRLLIDLEQWPHPDNRVVLTGERDRHGRPLARLHWHWTAEEEARRVRARAVVVRALERAGVGTVDVRPGVAIDSHAHHHAGTTRMHEDAANGVVDENLRVHGEENLYVVGSSVFPTAGVANPTLTIVALSARLAAHLAGAG
jgi:choline dehydrogenase-like flavoprotein